MKYDPMTETELIGWYNDDQFHQKTRESYGVTAICERGCPCERALSAYAAAVNLPDIPARDEIIEWIEDRHPEVQFD